MEQIGKIPTFGYPLITFSPPEPEKLLTDSLVRKHAIISDGDAIIDPNQEEFRMVSNVQLKQELTDKADRALAKGLPINKSN